VGTQKLKVGTQLKVVGALNLKSKWALIFKVGTSKIESGALKLKVGALN
jgi:hypothetical protein